MSLVSLPFTIITMIYRLDFGPKAKNVKKRDGENPEKQEENKARSPVPLPLQQKEVFKEGNLI